MAQSTDEDYLRLVDGPLRLDGTRAVFIDRHLGREGTLDAHASEIAARKDAKFQALVARE